ncbi:MAG: hypothetical protein C7B43_15890 [Sulfobacillus benefaciens]|uniref:Uncharacterized protein n=1 Tax=Sulfobacillus benefaciens TaxID=453960 RepID=A0A2T2WUG8_9FIRM|nr:MAG: hypothetical protein C7B43_15890 [Sulfobacillus benefaciens]
MVLSTVFVTSMAFSGSVAAKSTPTIRVKYLSKSAQPFASLSKGSEGTGFILYYVNHRTQPSLVVKLEKFTRNGIGYAYLYEASGSHNTIPVRQNGKDVGLPNGLKPSLIIASPDGYWVRRGIPNYNLNVKVFGPIYALWGSSPATRGVKQGILNNVGTHELLATIQTRTSSSGIPLWDLRQLVPKFSGEGVYRVNYAQREAPPSSWHFGQSVSPLWPYVALTGHFLQGTPDVLTPPIVVNWDIGKITRFSEVVSVRSQANGYDFYSISPLKTGQHVINHLDFESPWGFYNLASTPQSYPNLIIRTQHFYPHDPWSVGISPVLIGKPLLNKPEENVRYSWADHPGNQNFNFKVDVFGFHSYPEHVAIAGGQSQVQAPSYQQYPSWVLSHKWPSTTFIDVQSGVYTTSEGIYAWPAQNIGAPYWMGWNTKPNLSMFRSIPKGLRGEYRVNSNHRPELYASPVDGRMHLLYAQGGIWNINNHETLVEKNLNGGRFINAWELVNTRKNHVHTVSQLFALPGALLYQGPKGVILDHASYSSSAFTIMPPDSKASWTSFVHKVAAYKSGNNPLHLSQWLNRFPGYAIKGPGTISHVIDTANGFQFALNPRQIPLWRGYIQGLGVLKQRSVVISYDAKNSKWSIIPEVPNPVTGSLKSGAAVHVDTPVSENVQVDNHANYIASGKLSVVVNGHTQWSQQIQLAGSNHSTLSVPWTPVKSGIARMVVEWNGKPLAMKTISVAEVARTNPLRLWQETIPTSNEEWMVLGLVLVVSASGFWIWRKTF